MLPGAPTADIRVRSITSRSTATPVVKLLNGLAVPAVGCVPTDHPWFGTPLQDQGTSRRGQKLLAEAGYGGKKLKLKVAIRPRARARCIR